MRRDEFYWFSTDGVRFFAQDWQPDTAARGVVCLVHGLGEHSGRYQHVAQVLCNARYAFLTFDLRGHGKSSGPRGHTPSIEAYVEDIHHLLEEAQSRYPQAPCFLYGHSLGANIILYYTLKKQPSLAGVIVTGLALKSDLASQSLKVAAVRILGSIMGTVTLPSGLKQNDLSRDAEVVRAYRADPLIHDRVSLRFGKESLAAISFINKNVANFRVPILIMHGTKDTIAYPESSTEFAAGLQCPYTIKLWENMFHELHNEFGKEEVLSFMIKWIEDHT